MYKPGCQVGLPSELDLDLDLDKTKWLDRCIVRDGINVACVTVLTCVDPSTGEVVFSQPYKELDDGSLEPVVLGPGESIERCHCVPVEPPEIEDEKVHWAERCLIRDGVNVACVAVCTRLTSSGVIESVPYREMDNGSLAPIELQNGESIGRCICEPDEPESRVDIEYVCNSNTGFHDKVTIEIIDGQPQEPIVEQTDIPCQVEDDVETYSVCLNGTVHIRYVSVDEDTGAVTVISEEDTGQSCVDDIVVTNTCDNPVPVETCPDNPLEITYPDLLAALDLNNQLLTEQNNLMTQLLECLCDDNCPPEGTP